MAYAGLAYASELLRSRVDGCQHQWFRDVLKQAGVPDRLHTKCIDALDSHAIKSEGALIHALSAGEIEWGDLEIPREFRKQLRSTLCSKLPASLAVVRLACELAGLAYAQTGLKSNAGEAFKEKRKPHLLLPAQCPGSKQKYVLAVVKAGATHLLLVAFAGTHQKGDWKTNFQLLPESSELFGGSVHAGFLRRCEEVKFQFIRRIAVEFQCDRIIFTGHSLGGAISHLSCLRALRMEEFKQLKVKICSCAFAAPLVACAQVCSDIDRQGWTSNFMNFINMGDPVPRLLNLAESVPVLLEDCAGLASDAGDLARDLREVLILGLPAMMVDFALPSADFPKKLSESLQTLSKSQALDRLVQRVNAYKPFGTYIFIESSGDFSFCADSSDILDRLGPAKLLQQQINVEGILHVDNLRKHDLASYRLELDSQRSNEFFSQFGGSNFPDEAPHSAEQMCMNFDVKISQVYVTIDSEKVTYCVQGENLDLLGPCGLTLSLPGDRPIEVSFLQAMCSSPTAIFQQPTPEKEEDKPGHFCKLCFKADVGPPNTYELSKTNILSVDDSDDASQVSFDKHFFRRAMKLAWLQKKYSQCSELLHCLAKFEVIVQEPGDGPSMCDDANREWDEGEALCSIGEDPRMQERLKKITDWVCPESGLILLTKTQKAGRYAAVLGGFALGACALVAGGGISFFLPMFATGGVLTSVLAPTAASLAAVYYFRSVLSHRYDKFLMELLQAVGVNVMNHPKLAVMSEFKKEKLLMMQVGKSGVESALQSGHLSNLTDDSIKTLKDRIEAINLIHSMKQHVAGAHVSVCGPANSGKTTLISQMMMDPDIEAGAGFDLDRRTTGVFARRWGNSAFILDSPGLDAAQADLMRKFELSSSLFGKAYIYIRVWQGPEQRDDIETLTKILDSCTATSPHVLVVLNRVIQLRKDARGHEQSRKQLEENNARHLKVMKEDFYRRRQVPLQALDLPTSVQSLLAVKFKNVKIVLGELSHTRSEIVKLAPDIADMIYDAKRIAKWCEGVVDPEGSLGLESLVDRIGFKTWQEICDKADDERKQAAEALESDSDLSFF
eukprot:TRINITY_DN31492_c0_g1_i2.p1 TRINITY_DN31492_c0_g1~~TRINITY_DN31492_c0_g1_i2.p1  ORF type:complete len:1067 (-),score=185.57 TRINITY_DN31492_c0_g1_i2:126-3326(-)